MVGTQQAGKKNNSTMMTTRTIFVMNSHWNGVRWRKRVVLSVLLLCPLHLGGIQPIYIIQNALPTDKQCSATKSLRTPKHIYYFCLMVTARASRSLTRALRFHCSPVTSSITERFILYYFFFSLLFWSKCYCCSYVHTVSVQLCNSLFVCVLFFFIWIFNNCHFCIWPYKIYTRCSNY